MANSKPSIPSAQVFTSDPLEHVYAQQLPTMDGLAYMFLQNTRNRREAGADQYMQGVDRANRMSMALGQLEEQAKMRMNSQDNMTKLALGGYTPSNMLAGGAATIFDNPGVADANANTFSGLRLSEIAKNNASAAHAGDAGAPMLTYKSQAFPGETSTVDEFTGKGRNPEQVQTMVNAATKAALAKKAAENQRPLSPANAARQRALDAAQGH